VFASLFEPSPAKAQDQQAPQKTYKDRLFQWFDWFCGKVYQKIMHQH
jgi:hypothetical protein